MNKKLKVYTIAFIVVLILSFKNNVFHFESYSWTKGGEDKLEFVDEAPGFATTDTLENGAVRTISHTTIAYDVYVKPKDASNQKTLISTAKWSNPNMVEKQVYKVTMQKVKLETPDTKNLFGIQTVLLIASAIVISIVTIWILIMVIKLLRSIRRGEVFVTQVAKYLETTGYLLTVLYLIQWGVSYAFTEYCRSHIQLADYYIVYKNDANDMFIITGLALMIISQIILMGKDLKEEQELTI